MDTNEKEDHNPFPDRNPADQSVKWMRKIRRQRGSKTVQGHLKKKAALQNKEKLKRAGLE